MGMKIAGQTQVVWGRDDSGGQRANPDRLHNAVLPAGVCGVRHVAEPKVLGVAPVAVFGRFGARVKLERK